MFAQLRQSLINRAPITEIEANGHKYRLRVWPTGWAELRIDGMEKLRGYTNLVAKRLREWEAKEFTRIQ